MSSHLRVLRTAGLIAERRNGRFRYYSLDPGGPARDVIQTLQVLFRSSLDDVKAMAESVTEPAETAKREASRRAG